MNNEERLRVSLPISLSTSTMQRMQFSQSAQTSPTQQPLTMLSGRSPPYMQGVGRMVGSYDPRNQERLPKEFLRNTLNPREIGSGAKPVPSWYLSTQREEQSLYSSQSMSMSSNILRKNSDNGKPVTRPIVPFTSVKLDAPIFKDRRTSPTSELQRSGQEIRQKLAAYFEKNKSSRDEYYPRPYSSEEKSSEKCSNEEYKSFYSDLFTEDNEKELDRSYPMFIKRGQFNFYTKTPRIDTKRILEMEPKRNTNVMPTRVEDSECGAASSPFTANFKRQPKPVSSMPGLKLEDFKLWKEIGSGRFGKVHLARHKLTRTIYAVKKMSKKMIKSLKMCHQVILEIKLQMFLDHPNIVKLYGFFDDIEYIYLVMEYMEEGTLYERIQRQYTGFKEQYIAITTSEISKAVQCMDDQFVAHRDIKPENILMSHNIAKISDFGWSTVCNERRHTYCATPAYLSPEMVEGKDYDQTIDLWCLGVLVYEMVTGKVPFSNPSKRETYRQILNADLTKLTWPETASAEVRDFVYSLLQKNPAHRMKAINLLNHPFLRQVCSE